MRSGWVLLVSCFMVAAASQIASASPPIIVSVDIDRTLRANAPGLISYDEKIVVRASDSDYASDLACVKVTDSADPPNVVFLTVCNGEGRQTGLTTASYTWTKRDMPVPPPPAPYTIEVRDFEGNADVITTGAPPAMRGDHMAVVAPVMDSTIYQVPPTRLAPTLQWLNASSVPEKITRIDVYEEGAQSGIWFKNTTDGSTSVVFANGGTSYTGRTQLYPNHSYVWTVRSGTNTPIYERLGDPVTNYHHVVVRDWEELHGRFTVYGAWTNLPAPPALPGKIAYGIESVAILTTNNWGVTGIMGYNTDPATRAWLGPEMANSPDWSPDGERLVYATPAGLYIDDFSGDAPTHIPGTTGADAKCRWTPDGNQIIFGRCLSGAPYGLPRSYQLWVMNQDGTDARPIVAQASSELCASPSPAGDWIAYHRTDTVNPPAVHIVRYDGSDDQEVIATGVAGYDPSYVVTSLVQPAWSPDGVALAVVFRAEASGLPELVGIGTMPAGGGLVTPVFISPYYACCATPQLPAWSPDATKIVFSSAHQRPDVSDYGTISASELWMVEADGSSPGPIRLTDDYSLNRNVSWWGMNTPVGTNVVFRRNGVKLVFETVTVAGMTDVKLLGQPQGSPPPGLGFLGKSYQAITTAQYTGKITVEVHYDDTDVAAGQEDSLALLHWENGQWVDITTPPVDTVNNVIRGECSDLGDFAIAIGGGPTADFSAVPLSGSAPLLVQFTDASTGSPSSWQWDFGDGATSTEQSPSHTYSAAGTYDVTLAVTSAAGSGAPVTKASYVTVTMAPLVADFSLAPARGTAPLDVNFTDLSTGQPTGWSWDFGDGGSATTQHPSHTYAAEGVYTVSLTVSNAGGTHARTKAGAVTVLPPPPVAEFAVAPASGILPLNVSFSDLSSNAPASWLWSFGDGATSTLQNPSHTFGTAGLYTVSLTATNAGGSSTCTKAGVITVLPPPPAADFAAAPNRGVMPLTVNFTDLSVGVVTSRSWDFGDGAASTEPSPVHVYEIPGTYTVTLTAANAGGASTNTKAGYVVVTVPPPVADLSAAPTSGATPLVVQFSDASAGDATSWLWEFGDGSTSTEASPAHTYTGAGVHSVKLTVTNAGGEDTCIRDGLITVLPAPPAAGFSAHPGNGVAPLAVSFTDTSTGAATWWLWDFGDGSTSTLRNPTHTYAGVGSYAVTLTAGNAGGSNTVTVAGCVTTYEFVGPLSPIGADGVMDMRGNRPSVPVRFQLTAADGSPVSTADARLFVAQVGTGGGYAPAVSNDYAGNAFVYDSKARYYEFPLAVRAMSARAWSLRVTVSGAVAREFSITLIKK